MSHRIPIEVAQVSTTTTYTGPHRLFWMTVVATADAVVTISDDSTELVRVSCVAKATEHLIFQPTIVCGTSLVVTEVSGTAIITTARSGG